MEKLFNLERYIINNAHRLLKASGLLLEILLMGLFFFLLLETFSPEFKVNKSNLENGMLLVTGVLLWLSISTIAGYNDHEGFIDVSYMLKWGIICSLVSSVLFGLLVDNYGFLNYSSSVAFIFSISIFSSIVPLRFLFIQTYKYRRIFLKNSRIMIVGRGQSAYELHDFFEKFRAAKLIHIMNGETHGLGERELINQAHEKVHEIKALALENNISEIYWNLPLTGTKILEEVAEFAFDNCINFKIANDFNYLEQDSQVLGYFNGKPIISLKNPPLASFINRQIKRAFDIVFSLLVLILVFPPLALVLGILIKLDSKGPVFFIQDRVGRKNKSFRCLKFRTMRTEDEEENAKYQQARKNDPRLTRIGSFLRKYNLDEFPQFINVLQGDMSVIGPRPHPPKLDQTYIPLIKHYQYRYYIKPGITGWAQIHGYRGETSDPSVMKKRIDHDNWYIENWDLSVDIKIIFLTVYNMIKGEENAY